MACSGPELRDSPRRSRGGSRVKVLRGRARMPTEPDRGRSAFIKGPRGGRCVHGHVPPASILTREKEDGALAVVLGKEEALPCASEGQR